MFLLGGVWAALLSQSRNNNMYICDRCHYVFKHDTPTAKGFALFVALIAFSVAILGFIYYEFSN